MIAKRSVWLVGLVSLSLPGSPMDAQEERFRLSGRILAPDGGPILGATLSAAGSETCTDANGAFQLQLPRGPVHVVAHASERAGFETELDLESDQALQIELRANESVTVRASADVLEPDPAASAYTREDLLPANPGRPGIPFSVPGFPTETASGGIKAPQYFAPGVAGDHGEPIAQFFQVGGYQFQNNLTANAHGNGYADPNIVIPAVVSGVEVDNAAFNARYGDHAIDLAVNYGVRDRMVPVMEWTSDGRDGDVAVGWSPSGSKTEWLAAELSFGNGFLARPEEREQYKLNGLRAWNLGRNALTVFGIGYYGFSRVPGLIPLYTPVADDTIDTRQKDLTHTTLGIVTDTWQRRENEQLVVSGFNRTYSLALDSDFGLGLLEQSEFRTVQGGNATYARGFGSRWTLLGGMDYRRDAPRNLDLAHTDLEYADGAGPLQLVTSNNLTITDYGPFGALQGPLGHSLRVYAGVRRDWVHFANTDKVTQANSYTEVPALTSPKLTATWGEETGRLLPQVSFSWAKAFHANDPRIGSGTGHGALLIGSRELQLVAGKVVAGTELRLTLAHVTNAEELAKIDPDTGLQQDVGPSLNRYFTLMARRRYGPGFVQASYSQADARDRTVGLAVPEAPRLIVDAIGTDERLPWGLIGKAEYEYVGEKPLGDGFRAVPVQELRLDLQRSLRDGRWTVATEAELASGASGQTLETFALPGESAATERSVGVPLRSYGSVSVQYRFGR